MHSFKPEYSYDFTERINLIYLAMDALYIARRRIRWPNGAHFMLLYKSFSKKLLHQPVILKYFSKGTDISLNPRAFSRTLGILSCNFLKYRGVGPHTRVLSPVLFKKKGPLLTPGGQRYIPIIL